MKHILLTILGSFYIFYVSAQNNIRINGQINDTVILQIENPKGSIQWQSSTDNKTWTDISGENNEIYKVTISSESYYRATVSGMSCGTIVTNSIETAFFNEAIDTLSINDTEMLLFQCYLPIRAWYGKEVGTNLTELGTDIYTRGLDNRALDIANYDTINELNANYLTALWNELYRGLINCNAAVNFIGKSSLSDVEKTKKEAEVRFLRAFYLWHIVETWGGAMYTLDFRPLEQNSFSTVPVDTMYNQIIRDLIFAETNLPAKSEVKTELSKQVARAFLARIYLTRGINDKALSYSEMIIKSGEFALSNNLDSVWYIHNRQNPEFIYALDNTIYPDPLNSYAENIYNYSNNVTFLCLREGGNQNHLMFEIRYESLSWGLMRSIQDGRGYQRYMPTKFFIDLFDETTDKRFNSSFKNVWYANYIDLIPNWKHNYYINGIKYAVPAEKVGTDMFALEDTAVYFSKTPVPKSQKAKFDTTDLYYFHPEKGYLIIDINDMYQPNGTPDSANNRQYYFPITKKFYDNTKASIAQQYSSRNAVILRISEMYLIAAEAAYKTGNTVLAYDYLLALANSRSYTGDGAALLSKYGINSGTDIDIDFILDERARELAGEQLRWFDLKRTGKLVERVAAHNTDVGNNIKEFHNLRYIPINQPELIYKFDGLKQNPGYE